MGFIVFEEEAFNYLDAQLENFVKRMDRIRERSEDKTMNKWLDTQDVCQTLNICPRTVQTLRDNGTWLIRKSATRPTTSRGRDGYRSSSGGQEKGHALSQAHRLGCQYTTAT
jgi:hypothetical protein